MVKFPDPIALADSVFEQRKFRLKQLMHSCAWGMAIRFAIIVCELVGVFIFGSAALLMDAVASLVDVFSTLLLLVCIRLAARPPDTNHPFGHGRFEPLIGLQLGIFMALVGGGMLVQQGVQFSRTLSGMAIDSRAWIIPLVATLLLETCYQVVIRVAKKQHSPALAADAVHYRIDGMTSLCATVALGVGVFFPEWSHSLDHMGALLIALLMVGMGINAARQNINQLLDRAPEKQFFDRVDAAARRVEGVRATEKIRIQSYGPDAHVDIDVEVDPNLSVEVAHAISQKVRVEIQNAWPSVQDVTVHIEPFYPNDH